MGSNILSNLFDTLHQFTFTVLLAINWKALLLVMHGDVFKAASKFAPRSMVLSPAALSSAFSFLVCSHSCNGLHVGGKAGQLFSYFNGCVSCAGMITVNEHLLHAHTILN